MGLGDSIMSGFGSRISNFWQLFKTNPLNQYRGSNFATGGDDDSLSIGNLIKHYSPNIVGLSKGVRAFEICYGPLCPSAFFGDNVPVQGLNAAEAGAWAENFKPQIDYFKKHLPEVDPHWETSFKYLTFQLGYNDLCLGCFKWTQDLEFDATKYEINLRVALNELRKTVPNVIVNLLPTFDLSQLATITSKSRACNAIRTGFPVECTCLLDVTDNLTGSRANMRRLSERYANVTRLLAAEFNALKDPGFAVIYDHGMHDLNLENGPLWLVSAEDCFHPSKRAHDLFGISNWNNLFDPASLKSSYNYNVTTITCPTESDRIVIDYNL